MVIACTALNFVWAKVVTKYFLPHAISLLRNNHPYLFDRQTRERERKKVLWINCNFMSYISNKENAGKRLLLTESMNNGHNLKILPRSKNDCGMVINDSTRWCVRWKWMKKVVIISNWQKKFLPEIYILQCIFTSFHSNQRHHMHWALSIFHRLLLLLSSLVESPCVQ